MSTLISEGAEARSRQPWTRIALKVALIVIALLVSFWVTASAVDLTVYAAYKRYLGTFGEITGLDPYLANVVFLLFLVPFFVGVRSYLFGLKRTRRRTGLAILITLGALYNVSLYLATKNEYFVGKDTKYYALVPGGVVFSARSGREPRFGIPFQPVTPDKIKWLLRIQRGQIQPVADPARHDWFDGVTRDPLLWYYTDADGDFHFFDGPGYAPATGDELKPVTPDIRHLWERRARDRPNAATRSASDQSTEPPVTNTPSLLDSQLRATEERTETVSLPKIASFEVVPGSVDACKIAILRWTVTGATTVSIEPGVGTVNPSSGYRVVRPVQTIQYTLAAKGVDGSLASRDVTLAVTTTSKSSCGPN
jgi:hypothetical protein